MDVMTLALFTAGRIATFEVPLGRVPVAAPARSGDTYAGGFRIMRTAARRIIQLMGVGALRRLSAVRWGVAGSIVVAWIVTLPAAGSVAALAFSATDLVLG